MGACFQAKRLVSDLDLITSNGSLPVQSGISGLGHFQQFERSGIATTMTGFKVQPP
jgi:hypothetical protein